MELLEESKSILKSFFEFYATFPCNLVISYGDRKKVANQFFLDHAGSIEEVDTIRNFCIKSCIDDFEIPVRLYEKRANHSNKIIVFAHGGGWIQGNLETHDYLCRKMVNVLGLNVLAVNYRLAPEHKFPIPLQDVISVYKWSCNHYQDVYLSGDSAGGNLCAVLCVKAKSANFPKPKGLILFYPVLSNKTDSESYGLYGHLLSLSKASMKYFLKHYQPSEDISDNKYISPILEDDMSVYPRTFIASAECDVLLSEQLEFSQKMSQGTCEHVVLNGAVHGFMTFGKEFDKYNTKILEKVRKWLL